MRLILSTIHHRCMRCPKTFFHRCTWKKKRLVLTLFNRCGGGELALADAFLCNAQSWRQTLFGLHVQHQLLCTAGMEEQQNPSHSWEPERGGGHANSLDRVPDYIHIDTLTIQDKIKKKRLTQRVWTFGIYIKKKIIFSIMLTNKKWWFPEFKESLPSAQANTTALADILSPSLLKGEAVCQARG